MCNFDNVFTIYMIKLEEINWKKIAMQSVLWK